MYNFVSARFAIYKKKEIRYDGRKIWECKMKKEKLTRTSYLRGLLGALLGGLICFIMWALAAYFVGGNLHLSFGFVLALFIYYGYFALGGKNGKGFYAVFLPMLFLLGFLATAVSFGIIHMNGIGFTGDNFPLYASAYYGGNLLAAYFGELGNSIRQVFLQFSSLWPYFAISAIYEAVGAMCYGVRAGKQILTKAGQEAEAKKEEASEEK